MKYTKNHALAALLIIRLGTSYAECSDGANSLPAFIAEKYITPSNLVCQEVIVQSTGHLISSDAHNTITFGNLKNNGIVDLSGISQFDEYNNIGTLRNKGILRYVYNGENSGLLENSGSSSARVFNSTGLINNYGFISTEQTTNSGIINNFGSIAYNFGGFNGNNYSQKLDNKGDIFNYGTIRTGYITTVNNAARIQNNGVIDIYDSNLNNEGTIYNNGNLFISSGNDGNSSRITNSGIITGTGNLKASGTLHLPSEIVNNGLIDLPTIDLSNSGFWSGRLSLRNSGTIRSNIIQNIYSSVENNGVWQGDAIFTGQEISIENLRGLRNVGKVLLTDAKLNTNTSISDTSLSGKRTFISDVSEDWIGLSQIEYIGDYLRLTEEEGKLYAIYRDFAPHPQVPEPETLTFALLGIFVFFCGSRRGTGFIFSRILKKFKSP